MRELVECEQWWKTEMPTRTGFEGYCESAGSAFGALLSTFPSGGAGVDDKATPSLPDTPKVGFGAELFGVERFFTSATMRATTWRLKASVSGRENRYSVFHGVWVGKGKLEEAESLAVRGDLAKIPIALIKDVRGWRKEQRGRAAAALNTDAGNVALSEVYRSALRELADAADALSDSLRKREKGAVEELKKRYRPVFEAQAGPFDGWGAVLGRQRESLGEWLSSFAASRREPLLRSPSQQELRSALQRAIDDLDDFERRLSDLRRESARTQRELAESRRKLIERFPEEAVGNCVDSLLEDDASLLWLALESMGPRRFHVEFGTKVVPAIERGFRAEQYPEARIRGFVREMDQATADLTIGSKSSRGRYREFLTVLVRSLVYGPDSRSLGEGTDWEEDPMVDPDPAGRKIVLTQLLSPDSRLMGRVDVFTSDDIIFLGRQSDVELFRSRCAELMPTEVSEEGMLEGRDLRVFAIGDAHAQVSRLHGVIMCDEGAWRYRDFSSYGTRLVGRGKDGGQMDVWFRDEFRELEAGALLLLGAQADDGGEDRLYRSATAVRFSICVDEDNSSFNDPDF